MIRSFFRNAGMLAAAEFAARAKGFVVIPLLTHRLGASGYGVWTQVTVLVALLGPLIMLGTDSGVIRYLPGTDSAHRARSFVGWMLAVASASVGLCLAVALLRRPLAVLAFGSAGEYSRFIPLAAASILVTVVLNLARTWFRLENDAGRLAIMTAGQAALAIAALVAWYLLDDGLYRLVVYTVAADAVLAVAMLVVVRLRTGPVRPDFSILPRLARYGVVLLPAGYAIWALNWIDRIILVRFADIRAVGLYSLAYSLGYLVIQVAVNPIWTMFPNAVAEHWNTGHRDRAQRLFEATAGAILALSLPAIAGGVALSGAFLRILAPAEFVHAAPVVPLVLAGYLCFMLAAFYETVFGLADRQALGALTVGIACVVNVVLNLVLIPPFGYVGAAVATLLAFVFQLGMCVVLNHRLALIRTPMRIPVKIVAAAVLMGAALLPLRGFSAHHPLPGLAIGTVMGLALYVALLAILGVVRAGAVGGELRTLFQRSVTPASQVP